MKYDGAAAVAAPSSARLEDKLGRALLVLLALFLFVLPIFEAPKNVAAVLFLVVWCARAAVTRDLGGPWNRYDTAFLLVLASATASGLAGYAGDVKGVYSVVLLSWLVSRSPLGQREFRPLALAACLGLLLAIPDAAWNLLRGNKMFFELHSVGQVNQSALYMAVLAPAATGWWFQLARSGERGFARTGFAVSAAVFWGALLISASRAAILGAGVGVLGILGCIAWQTRHGDIRKLLVRAGVTLAVLVALVASLVAWSPGMSDHKLDPDRIVSTYSVASRMEHWRIAYESWKERPWLGWGPDSFKFFTVDDVCQWRAHRGEGCDRELYARTTHPHNLYLATLSERGVVGACALLLLFGLWAWSLLRNVRTSATAPYWVASASGLAVVVVGGMFNTTMRVEHGVIALGYFALWIAAHARPGARHAA
jgi:O-antigen ligase